MIDFEKEKELFERYSKLDSFLLSEEAGIGIYNEKRLHRILKRTLCERESCFEVKVGRYTADILEDGRIYEIQCGNFFPLKDKISYYLNSTEYDVTVVHPLIVKKTIIRAERQTGEILRIRRSPIKESPWSALAMLKPLNAFLTHPRFHLRLMLVEVEEYRYSEAMRYRKKGRYDSELFPIALVDTVVFDSPFDYKYFLPEELGNEEFSAADFAPYAPLRGLALYSALNTLATAELLERRKEGRRVRYRVKENNE